MYQPLVNALTGFYLLFGNFGWAIIGLTLAIRFLLLPLTLPSLKAAQKMRQLAEAVKQVFPKISANLKVVFLAKPSLKEAKFEDIIRELKKMALAPLR